MPLLALWLKLPPELIFSAEDRRVPVGQFIAPANAAVASDYILDPRDLNRRVISPPASFRLVGGNRSWRVYSSCPRPVR